jgi:hypothetical protein
VLLARRRRETMKKDGMKGKNEIKERDKKSSESYSL